jgi:hypothetical protein
MTKYRLPNPRKLHTVTLREFAASVQAIMYTRSGPDSAVVVDPDNEVGADAIAQILEAMTLADLDPIEEAPEVALTHTLKYVRFTDIVTDPDERERFAIEVSENVDGTWGDNCHSLIDWGALKRLLDDNGFTYAQPEEGVQYVDMEN